jgi:hypothetical protein
MLALLILIVKKKKKRAKRTKTFAKNKKSMHGGALFVPIGCLLCSFSLLSSDRQYLLFSLIIISILNYDFVLWLITILIDCLVVG